MYDCVGMVRIYDNYLHKLKSIYPILWQEYIENVVNKTVLCIQQYAGEVHEESITPRKYLAGKYSESGNIKDSEPTRYYNERKEVLG